MDVASMTNSVPQNFGTHNSNDTSSFKTVLTRINESADIAELSKEDMTNLAGSLNNEIKQNFNNVQFGYSEDLNQLIVEVKDNVSGRVIRQLPSKEALQLAKKVKELVGIILDTRA